MIKDLWFKLESLHCELIVIYGQLGYKKHKELKEDYNIDSGRDYADYIFNNAELLNFYNGN